MKMFSSKISKILQDWKLVLKYHFPIFLGNKKHFKKIWCIELMIDHSKKIQKDKENLNLQIVYAKKKTLVQKSIHETCKCLVHFNIFQSMMARKRLPTKELSNLCLKKFNFQNFYPILKSAKQNFMILDTSQLNQKLARSKICQIFYLVTADTFLRVDLHQNAEKESVFIIRFIKSS